MNKLLTADDLHPYQRRMVEHILATPRCALWAEMGLGKTVSTLTAVADLLDQVKAVRVLVVAPLRVVRSVWPNEINTWSHLTHLNLIALDPPAAVIRKKNENEESLKMRRKAARPLYRQWAATIRNHNAHIFTINRERLAHVVDCLASDWPFDMVVLDESQSFKNPSTKRWKAVRKILPKVDHLVELSGTPAPNGLLDVWGPMYFLDYGERLGKTFTAYKLRFFQPDYQGYNWTPLKHTADYVYSVAAGPCITLKTEDYLKLPKRVDNRVSVRMSPSCAKQYRDLERDYLIEIEDDEISALSAAALSNKLLQFANGAVYDEDKNTIEVHQHKLDALDEIIDEAMGEPILVAYNFKSDLARLLKRHKHGRVLDAKESTIREWNRGKIPLLFAHPASAGHGLNLQKGGNIIVWFGLNWSLELYAQFNARLHRQGQDKPVFIHHLVTENSIDETVLDAIAYKCQTQNDLMDAVKLDVKRRVQSC